MLDASDRLMNTPVPVSYTRHATRCLMMWLCLLPFALWPICGWGTVLATALTAFVLMGIEEIGERPGTAAAAALLSPGTHARVSSGPAPRRTPHHARTQSH